MTKYILLVVVSLLTGCASYEHDPSVSQGINRGLLNAIKHIK